MANNDIASAAPERTREALEQARVAAQTDLDEARARREDVSEQLDQLDRQIAELEQVLASLEGAQRPAATARGAPERPPARKKRAAKKTTRRKQQKRSGVSRTDLVAQILEEAGRPLELQEIVEQVHSRGRDDNRASISAALSYLAKRDRAERVGEALWASPQVAAE